MATGKKMGRPARAGGPARNLTVRASEQERALWEAAARDEGFVDEDDQVVLADWIRAACDERSARRR